MQFKGKSARKKNMEAAITFRKCMLPDCYVNPIASEVGKNF